jgi:hypothetical protein
VTTTTTTTTATVTVATSAYPVAMAVGGRHGDHIRDDGDDDDDDDDGDDDDGDGDGSGDNDAEDKDDGDGDDDAEIQRLNALFAADVEREGDALLTEGGWCDCSGDVHMCFLLCYSLGCATALVTFICVLCTLLSQLSHDQYAQPHTPQEWNRHRLFSSVTPTMSVTTRTPTAAAAAAAAAWVIPGLASADTFWRSAAAIRLERRQWRTLRL